MEKQDIFNVTKTPLKIDKPIRLIELFAGIGSQAKALKNLNADFEHYRVCDFDKYAIKSYNAIHGTNFATSDITKLVADDLGIADTDQYCYVMTYSFPCQDLSLAGKGKGMAKGDNTRSGLLWEVERLLNECTELPQILLMENVTQVHGKKNKEHFDEWIRFLESKGYSNYWQDLNAKNFGIPQNRNRTFMVSVLGDYTYKFPQEFPLTLRLKDMLEDSVDEKFYISNSKIDKIVNSTFAQEKAMIQKTDVCGTLLSRDYKDPKCVEVGNLTGGKWDKMHDVSRRVYSEDGIAPTIHTCGGGNTEPKVAEPTPIDYRYDEGVRIRKDGCMPKLNATHTGTTSMSGQGFVVEPKVIAGIGEKKSNGGTQWYQQNRIYDDNLAVCVTAATNPYYAIHKEPFICASRGRNPENPSDRTAGIPTEQRLEPNFSGCTNTLTTVQKDNYVCEPIVCEERKDEGLRFFKGDYVGTLRTIDACGDKRVVENGANSELRIRKLSPKECWRLMGFDDSDFEKAAQVNSNSQLYKQAGNSIVVDVLYHIFGEML